MSVLVTGVNCLVGLHMAKILLGEGFEVVGYDQMDISRAKKEFSYKVRYDLKGSLEDFIETLRQRGKRGNITS